MADTSAQDLVRLAVDIERASVTVTARAGQVMGKALNDIQSGAANRAPVDTGALKSSISTSVQRRGATIRGEVGPTVRYAGYVENGTIHMRAQPYLRPATDAVLPGYHAAMAKMMGDI